MQNLRYAVRTLLKNPGFTVIAVLTLALGIGANAAIFSVVYSALLRSLPYKDPGKLVTLAEGRGQAGGQAFDVSYPDFLDWRRMAKSYQALAGFGGDGFTLTGNGDPKNVSAVQVTTNLLSTLGVKPLLGRDFVDGEEKPDGPHVALLTYGFWRSEFGGDPGIVGRTIRLDNKPATVVGVLPREFEFAPGRSASALGTVTPDAGSSHTPQPSMDAGDCPPWPRCEFGSGARRDGRDYSATRARISERRWLNFRGDGQPAGKDRGSYSPSVDSPVWRGWICAPHRVRECGESSDDPLDRPPQGVRDSHGAWCKPGKPGIATTHGKRTAFRYWGGVWIYRRAVGRSHAGGSDSRGTAPDDAFPARRRHELAGASFLVWRHGAYSDRFRTGAGTFRFALVRERRAKDRVPRRYEHGSYAVDEMHS